MKDVTIAWVGSAIAFGVLAWKWRAIADAGVDLDWGIRHAAQDPFAGRMTMEQAYMQAVNQGCLCPPQANRMGK